jgi:SAM-dependent methyltransferase
MVTDAFKERVKRNVADHFDRSYRIYQAFEVKHGLFSALASHMASTIRLTPRSSVLDVGCGNGVSAMALHREYACSVLGVDLSPKMVSAGRGACGTLGIRLMVGDGEDLVRVTGGEIFDYVLYNASIFIFPDVSHTIDEAFQCLRPGGKIAFSFYPELVGANGQDLLALAFERLGLALPRYRVITDYAAACRALQERCGNLRRHCWQRPLDLELLEDFFTIPAQSASLFPGRSYEERCRCVKVLFRNLSDMAGTGHILWRMAEGSREPGEAQGQR